MKKLLFAIVLTAFLGSCKKDYTCQCSTAGVVLTNESIGEQTKKDADEICDERDDDIPGVECIAMEK